MLKPAENLTAVSSAAPPSPSRCPSSIASSTPTARRWTAEPLPVRFGTWTWGCGNTISQWVPKTTGKTYDCPSELQADRGRLKKKDQPVQRLFGEYRRPRRNQMHRTGYIGIRTGTAPTGTLLYEHPTIDVLISDAIGADTRFRSLDMAATGNPTHSYSARSTSIVNLAIPTPSALYQRVFGPEFQGSELQADFKPDPKIMARQSDLSSVAEQRAALVRRVAAADPARLDQYFTSIRQLEQQLDLQLQKPAPLEACTRPGKFDEKPAGTEIEDVLHNHKLMSVILAHALACNSAPRSSTWCSPTGPRRSAVRGCRTPTTPPPTTNRWTPSSAIRC